MLRALQHPQTKQRFRAIVMERFRRWTVLVAILGLVNSFGSGPIAVEAGIKLVDRVVFGNDPVVGLSYDGEASDEMCGNAPNLGCFRRPHSPCLLAAAP